MEPIYKVLKNLDDWIKDCIYDDEEVDKALLHYHDHVCWLNPTETTMARRTQKMCKRFCKRNNIPKDQNYPKFYDCDMCPNMIIRYQYKNDFIFALGNSYLFKKERKIE